MVGMVNCKCMGNGQKFLIWIITQFNFPRFWGSFQLCHACIREKDVERQSRLLFASPTYFAEQQQKIREEINYLISRFQDQGREPQMTYMRFFIESQQPSLYHFFHFCVMLLKGHCQYSLTNPLFVSKLALHIFSQNTRMCVTNAKKFIFVKCSLTSKPIGLLIQCFSANQWLYKSPPCPLQKGNFQNVSQQLAKFVLYLSYVQFCRRDRIVKSNPLLVSKLALHFFSQNTGMLLTNAKKCIFVKCSLTSKPNGLLVFFC